VSPIPPPLEPALYFVYNKYHNVIVSAFFSGVISCGNAALDCLITEVFPTNLRATGIAISMVAARLGGIIGNIVIAQLLDLYCPAPTFIVAALLIGETPNNDTSLLLSSYVGYHNELHYSLHLLSTYFNI
jgi:MFS family permease